MAAAEEAAADAIPAGRLGRPEEMAWAAAFLCSERAAYITGTATAVDGGVLRGIYRARGSLGRVGRDDQQDDA
jgi:3-oxoacyl-[acyl-carrier protein] reductase